MFLFQAIASQSSPAELQNKVNGLILQQQALMLGSIKGKISKEDIASSINAMYNFYSDNIRKLGPEYSAQKKDFFSFVDAWTPWTAKAIAASNIEAGTKELFTTMVSQGPDGISYDRKNDIDDAKRRLYSNFASVLKMCPDYSSEGTPISLSQAKMFADFLTKMADSSVMNYYQRRLLVAGMIEVASGQSAPDNWIFKFAGKEDAAAFVKVLGSLPGFEAQNVQQADAAGSSSVSFSLRQANGAAQQSEEFSAPSEALQVKEAPAKAKAASKSKAASTADTDGVVQMSSSSKTTFNMAETSVPYTAAKDEAIASTVAANPESYMKCQVAISGSASLLYGEGYETDERESYAFASLKAKDMIYSLATRFGFTISEPFETWIVSAEKGRGQEFLALLKKAGIKLDVIGSADMAVFYDGTNGAAWKAAADKNLSLAEKRAQLVVKYLTNLNNTVLAGSGNKLEFSNAPTGRLHIFQEFTDEQAKQLGMAKYGYVKGEGASNMAALANYLKSAYTIEKDGLLWIGQKSSAFTDSESADAKKYYEKLSQLVNADGTLKQGAASQLNTYFRRMDGDPTLKGAGVKGGMIMEGKGGSSGNVFARAIMESTEISSRSVSLASKAEAELRITVKAEDGKPKADAEYRINGVPVEFNDKNGTIETDIAKTIAGDRVIGVARTLDSKISSGYAWETVPLEKVVEIPPLIIPAEPPKKTKENLQPYNVATRPVISSVVLIPGDTKMKISSTIENQYGHDPIRKLYDIVNNGGLVNQLYNASNPSDSNTVYGLILASGRTAAWENSLNAGYTVQAFFEALLNDPAKAFAMVKEGTPLYNLTYIAFGPRSSANKSLTRVARNIDAGDINVQVNLATLYKKGRYDPSGMLVLGLYGGVEKDKTTITPVDEKTFKPFSINENYTRLGGNIGYYVIPWKLLTTVGVEQEIKSTKINFPSEEVDFSKSAQSALTFDATKFTNLTKKLNQFVLTTQASGFVPINSNQWGAGVSVRLRYNEQGKLSPFLRSSFQYAPNTIEPYSLSGGAGLQTKIFKNLDLVGGADLTTSLGVKGATTKGIGVSYNVGLIYNLPTVGSVGTSYTRKKDY